MFGRLAVQCDYYSTLAEIEEQSLFEIELRVREREGCVCMIVSPSFVPDIDVRYTDPSATQRYPNAPKRTQISTQTHPKRPKMAETLEFWVRLG